MWVRLSQPSISFAVVFASIINSSSSFHSLHKLFISSQEEANEKKILHEKNIITKPSFTIEPIPYKPISIYE